MIRPRTIDVSYNRALAGVGSLFLYGLAGVIGTSVHFAVLFATVGFLAPVLASTLGAVAGCIVNYFLVRRFVFMSAAPGNFTFPRFLTVAAIGLTVNAAIIQTFVNVLSIGVNQLLASVIVFGVGFTLNRKWTFHEHKV
jgi:putative flippase GtrA